MYLSHCNFLEVENYLKKHDTVIIPVGSIENHGKHMPLGTDTMIPDQIIKLMEDKNSEFMVAPTVNYGATDDLMGFAGTISLGVEGLRSLLQTICDQLYDYGFRRFVILNGHGGNSKSISMAGEHLHRKGAYLACIRWWLVAGELNPDWKGGHGGGEETAGVMACDPSLIKTEYLEEGENICNDVSEELPSAAWTAVKFKGANVIMPRAIKNITGNGWLAHGMGIDPPTKATEAWGKEMLDTMADYIIDFSRTLERAELPK